MRWSKMSACIRLVVPPVRVVGEAVDLQGQTLGPRLELPHQERHVLVDGGDGSAR